MQSGRIRVFDLDRTLITTNSSYDFCKFLHHHKALSTLTLIQAYWYRLRNDFSSVGLEELHKNVFQCLLKGFSIETLENYADKFVENSIFSSFYLPVLEELKFSQHRGDYTMIMSSSPAFLVRRVAEMLEVDEWVATEYCLDSGNCLIDIKQFVDGKAKAKTLTTLVEKIGGTLKEVTAYSDSYHDLPLLKLAGEAVAVNPDAKLLAYSQEKRWRIL